MSEHSPTQRASLISRLFHFTYELYILIFVVSGAAYWLIYLFSSGSAAEKDATLFEYKFKVATWAFSTLPIFLLFLLMYFAITYGRKAKYAEVLEHLHGIQHELRDLYSQMKKFQRDHEIPEGNRSAFIETMTKSYKGMFDSQMQLILSRLASSYAITTGVNCRASIKLIGVLDKAKELTAENLYVRTLVRDKNSSHECMEKDQQEVNEKNLVSNNTDFEQIVKNRRSYYYSGNINEEDIYDNSSRQYWAQNYPLRAIVKKKLPTFLKLLGLMKAEWDTLFPYVSVMVFPIRYKEKKDGPGIPIGFLSVDSKSRRCFWERYDVHMGASIADSIYHVLEEYAFFSSKLKNLAAEGTKNAN